MCIRDSAYISRKFSRRAFVMLGFGGFGGLINMAYSMNAMIHNTSWVTERTMGRLALGGKIPRSPSTSIG